MSTEFQTERETKTIDDRGTVVLSLYPIHPPHSPLHRFLSPTAGRLPPFPYPQRASRHGPLPHRCSFPKNSPGGRVPAATAAVMATGKASFSLRMDPRRRRKSRSDLLFLQLSNSCHDLTRLGQRRLLSDVAMPDESCRPERYLSNVRPDRERRIDQAPCSAWPAVQGVGDDEAQLRSSLSGLFTPPQTDRCMGHAVKTGRLPASPTAPRPG